MVEKLIRSLILLVVLVGCVFLVLYVVAQLGFAIPAMIVNVIWLLVLLVVILFLWRTFGGYVGSP